MSGQFAGINWSHTTCNAEPAEVLVAAPNRQSALDHVVVVSCPTRFSIRSPRLSVLTRSSLIAQASACRAESGPVDTESDHRGLGTSLLKEAHMRTRQKELTS